MRLFSLRWPKMVGGLAVMAAGVALATDLTGAGSTFVNPILSKWSADCSVKTGDRLNYQSIGSGGGEEGSERHIRAESFHQAPSDGAVPLDEESRHGDSAHDRRVSSVSEKRAGHGGSGNRFNANPRPLEHARRRDERRAGPEYANSDCHKEGCRQHRPQRMMIAADEHLDGSRHDLRRSYDRS
jgi:hypothetical protein